MCRFPHIVLATLMFAALVAPGAALGQSASPAPPSDDPQARLARLADQVSHLDPKSPTYAPRVKAVLEELVRVNQELARENAALKAQQAAGPSSARPKKPRASGGASAARTASGAATTAGTTGAQAGPLFGKRGLKKYHRAGCTFGERIKAEDRVYFATPAAAQAAGYEPCKVCHPEAFTPPAPASSPTGSKAP